MVAIKEGELISYNPLDEEIEVNLIEDEEEREKQIQLVIMPCLSTQTDLRKHFIGLKQKWKATHLNTQWVIERKRLYILGERLRWHGV